MKTETRIRFNWGFHDGANDEQKSRQAPWKTHFDAIYVEGYKAGRKSVQLGEYVGDSSEAWKARPNRVQRKLNKLLGG